MSERWLKPISWSEGVTPPLISIVHPDIMIDVVMPSPIKEFLPVFIGGKIKRAKYTGKIHKAYPFESFSGELTFVLRADQNPRNSFGDRHLDLNEIDIVELIHKTDKLIDVVADIEQPKKDDFFHHGIRAEYYPEDMADKPAYTYNFRLESPPKLKNIGVSAWEVTFEIAINGLITEYPYNTV